MEKLHTSQLGLVCLTVLGAVVTIPVLEILSSNLLFHV
jgi:hypothetical protein